MCVLVFSWMDDRNYLIYTRLGEGRKEGSNDRGGRSIFITIKIQLWARVGRHQPTNHLSHSHSTIASTIVFSSR